MLGGVASARPGEGRGRGRGRPDERQSEDGPGGSNGADPKAACGECSEGYYYEKIDGAPEKGDEYTLESGATIIITDVEKNDDGEVVCIKFDSDGIVEKLCIKGGPETKVYDDVTLADYDERWFCAPDNPNSGKKYEISNVAYCNSPAVMFQADLVVGPAICQFDESEGVTYNAQNRILNSTTFALPAAVASETVGVSCAGGSGTSVSEFEDKDQCFSPDWAFFDAESDGKVSVRWQGTVDCDETLPLTLAVYRLPASGEIYPLDDQTLVACASIGVDASTSSVSIGDGDSSNDLYLYVTDGCSNTV
ncbi:hypothetical protein N0B31_04165 [Salinirubellus salinus]|uniref:Uncharacterized protein n=1 Tax=Salinirubellus salinus TaxID=1364945 RepID=A0A9E7R511_9EURY|nr:hypothetical protein [Salinirubellus salinus]UWM55483.1 hypothetical protein N0B31_04165 [Salinirubellus salinus]